MTMPVTVDFGAIADADAIVAGDPRVFVVR
jgi:hypothetical protein